MAGQDLIFVCRLDRFSFFETMRRYRDEGGVFGKIISVRTHGAAVECMIVDKVFQLVGDDCEEYGRQLLSIDLDDIGGVSVFSNFDIPWVSSIAKELREAGCSVVVPKVSTQEVCLNKRRTGEFIRSLGLDAPATYIDADGFSVDIEFPAIVKPECGQASVDVHMARTLEEVRFFSARTPRPLVQEFLLGAHYTIDVFNDEQGLPICCVPRRRVEVSGSSSVVSTVEMRSDLIELGSYVAGKLGDPGLMNVQVICTEDGRCVVHDINPRMASGAVLSMRAGAPFVRWTVELMLGGIQSRRFEVVDGATIMRYLSEAYVEPRGAPRYGARGIN